MALIGYARVSTEEQKLDIQIDALKAAGCRRVFSEKYSGKSKEDRKQFKECMDYLRDGDILVITRVDRLARSLLDLQTIVKELQRREIELRVLEQPVDTTTASGNAFLSMLGVFAEFEYNLRKERQQEGIAKAKAKGLYQGRAKTAQAKSKEVLELSDQGLTRQQVADKVGIGIASVYRILRKAKA